MLADDNDEIVRNKYNKYIDKGINDIETSTALKQ